MYDKKPNFFGLGKSSRPKNIVFFPRDYSVFRIVQFGEKIEKKIDPALVQFQKMLILAFEANSAYGPAKMTFFIFYLICEICISYLKYFSNFSGKKYGKIISFFVLSSCCPYFSRYIQICTFSRNVWKSFQFDA